MAVSWIPEGEAEVVIGSDDALARLAHRVAEEATRGVRVVTVAGSVAAGKTSFAARLAATLRAAGTSTTVVATDAFLLPNDVLHARGLSGRKGFPESYDTARAAAFVASIRSGTQAEIPVYSHEVYDVVAGAVEVVEPAEVVVIEGVNALQPEMRSVSDRGVYLDAAEADLERWYCDRFVALCRAAESDPTSFYRWAVGLDDEARRHTARHMWETVNLVNLRECISPTRAAADVVIEKGPDHALRRVMVPSRW